MSLKEFFVAQRDKVLTWGCGFVAGILAFVAIVLSLLIGFIFIWANFVPRFGPNSLPMP